LVPQAEASIVSTFSDRIMRLIAALAVASLSRESPKVELGK
jgi:hypothetical protein